MEQQPRKRGRPRLLVTADVVERRKNSKRLQNANRAYKRGEELSEKGCSAHSPNIAGSPTGGQSSSGACPALDDTRLAGNANIEETSLGPELTRIGAGTGCSNLYEASVTGSANTENTTTGPELTTIGAEAGSSNLYGSSVAGSANTENTTTGLLETPRQRTFIDKKKKAFNDSNVVLDLGPPSETCASCRAMVWPAEFTGRHAGQVPKSYSICCGKGKVQLPPLRQAPQELIQLLTGHGAVAKAFFYGSRMFNTVFAFCSFGGKVDDSINSGRGPYVFRVTGQVYHNFGSLIPPDRITPKFAQLYIYDGQHANEHRLNFTQSPDDCKA